LDVAARKVDFPAFGKPSNPASAISFNRSQIVRSTSGWPEFARRGLIGRGFEMQVAETAVAAFGQNNPLADLGDIGDDSFLIFFEDLGADRNAQDDILAIFAGALPPHARTAVSGKEVLLIAEIDQRVQAHSRFHPRLTAP
jgi:hypothetical protein